MIIDQISNLFYPRNQGFVITTFWNSLYLAFLLLPLGIHLPTPFFIISGFFGACNLLQNRKYFELENKALLLLPLYFLILLSSMLYTENTKAGMDLIIRSLSLFVFPILFLFVKEDAATVKRLFEFLLIGLLISFVIRLGGLLVIWSYDFLAQYATIASSTYSDWFTALGKIKSTIFYLQLRYGVNSNYLTIYILLVLGYFLKKKLINNTRLLILLVLFLYLFYVASWAGYISMGIMSILLIRNIKDSQKKRLLYIVFILANLFFVNSSQLFAYLSNRNIQTHAADSFEIERSRWATWQASITLIKSAPVWGYGIGDAQDRLLSQFGSLALTQQLMDKKYNAHNQFLQTWLQVGIWGILVLLLVFILLYQRMKRSANELAVFFILLIALLFESMWVRFNGVVFFAILIPLLLKERSILSSTIIRNR